MFILKANQIWVADIISHKWLIKRTNIKIKKNEMIHYSAWIQKSRIFHFGGGILSDRISVRFAVEINMHNCNQQRTELGKLSLCEVLGVRKSDGVEWLFFFTNRNGLIAIDPANMKYMDAPQSLLHKIRNNIPRPSNGIDQFSPDDTAFYLLHNRMGKRFVEIYDVEENLLRKEICYEDIGGFALMNDYKIIAYNRKTGTLYLHELRLQNNITIIQSGFFSGEPAFYNSFPISFVVDRLTSNYLFLALHPNGDRFRIVVVNHKNVIMAISNEQPILHKEWMTSEMLLVPSGCLVSFFVQKGQSEFRNNGVNSYVYHIEFHRENGQLVFEKYSRD